MRRRLQESFHMSTGGGPGGILGNGGFMASLTGGGCSAQSQIPSISVSVQTEPTMMGSSTIANGGHTILQNGVGGPQTNGGSINVSNGNRNSNQVNSHASTIMALHHHSATLPHHSALSKHELSSFSHRGTTGNGVIGMTQGEYYRSRIFLYVNQEYYFIQISYI